MYVYTIDHRHHHGLNCFDSREAAEAECRRCDIKPKWIIESWMVNLAVVHGFPPIE